MWKNCVSFLQSVIPRYLTQLCTNISVIINRSITTSTETPFCQQNGWHHRKPEESDILCVAGVMPTALLLQIHHVCDKWRMMFLIATTFNCTTAQPWGTSQKLCVCERISAINVSKCVYVCLNLKLMQLILRITADEVLVCNLSVFICEVSQLKDIIVLLITSQVSVYKSGMKITSVLLRSYDPKPSKDLLFNKKVYGCDVQIIVFQFIIRKSFVCLF